MSFELPRFNKIEFESEPFISMPNVKTSYVTAGGVSPEYYHATSIYPEYFKIQNRWILAPESRMDCVVIIKENNILEVKEFRNLEVGDEVILGRTENGSEGIYVQVNPFLKKDAQKEDAQAFSFRSGRSRESSFSKDYDELIDLLKYEREHGYIVWVLGPAVIFDYESRKSFENLINNGYVHAIFAGNAVATHDMEGAYFGTALGVDIYKQSSAPNGHYNHLEIINKARNSGSIENFIKDENINNGIMYACVKNNIPFVLAGSLRDDGPLPGVISDVYKAQDAMREHCRKATTIIGLASMLHTIATGNMTPIYKVQEDSVRPVYFYNVDASEFAANKLRDRGSLSVTSIITNVQDFLVNINRNIVP